MQFPHFPFFIFHSNTALDLDKASTKRFYHERHKFILTKLRSFGDSKNITLVNTFELLCSEDGCPAVANGKALYFDDDHLSLYGSELLWRRAKIWDTLPPRI